MLVELSTT